MSDDSAIKIRPHSVAGVMVEQTMLLPSAELVAKHLCAVPRGQTRTLAAVREQMAAEKGAEATCPVTTQRMIRIVAEQSVLDHAAGRQAVPFWRVVDPDKPNSRKLPGGRDFIVARLKEEKP